MRKLLALVAVLSLGGCTLIHDGVANTTNSFRSGSKKTGYQEIVYVKVKRCSDWKEPESVCKGVVPKSDADINFCARAASRRASARQAFLEECVNEDEYKKLKNSEKCRFDYFGVLECQQVVDNAEWADELRRQNKTAFEIEWRYEEKHSYYGTMDRISRDTYDVRVYASAVQKLKKNKNCKFKSQKEIECNMRPPKEFVKTSF